MQIVKLTNQDKGTLWNLLVKYEEVNPKFSDALNNVILGKETQEDMMVIANNMDFRDVDEDDFWTLQETIGAEVDAMMFNV